MQDDLRGCKGEHLGVRWPGEGGVPAGAGLARTPPLKSSPPTHQDEDVGLSGLGDEGPDGQVVVDAAVAQEDLAVAAQVRARNAHGTRRQAHKGVAQRHRLAKAQEQRGLE
jgi:hypothetical protein